MLYTAVYKRRVEVSRRDTAELRRYNQVQPSTAGRTVRTVKSAALSGKCYAQQALTGRNSLDAAMQKQWPRPQI